MMNRKKTVLISFIAVFLIIAAFFIVEIRSLPQLPESLDEIGLSFPTVIYASNNEVLERLGSRINIELNQISPHYLKSIVAIEDKNFYSHHGIHIPRLIKAVFEGLIKMDKIQGTSTITQQLVRNLFLSFERTIDRKFKEMLLAFQFERIYEKDEILKAYCNQIYMGAGAYGVEAASLTYFAKHADQLDLAEATFLAAIARNGRYYNPYQNFERALKRQRLILKVLRARNIITELEKAEALNKEIELRNVMSRSRLAPHFLEMVKNYIADTFGENLLNYGGLKIYTTLDIEMQEKAYESLSSSLYRIDQRITGRNYQMAVGEERKDFPEAALVAIDPLSGGLRALIGSRDRTGDYFNRVLSNNRSPGSAIKPFVYLTAIESGMYTPETVVVDSPVTFTVYNDIWEPHNFTEEFLGPVILKYALMQSINVISAMLVHRLTPEKVIETAHRIGIMSDIEPHLSISLGSCSLSPYELASSYGVLATEGIKREPFFIEKIEGPDGKIYQEHVISSERVIDEKNSYLLLDMMKGVLGDGGTGRSVRTLGFLLPAAGKTGTSDENRDSWFCGFTPDLSCVTWLGFDDNRRIIDRNGVEITGASGGLILWAEFMKSIENSLKGNDFEIPIGIKFKYVDKNSGVEVRAENQNALRVAYKSIN